MIIQTKNKWLLGKINEFSDKRDQKGKLAL